MISVSDTGIGISPDDLQTIFDLFEQGSTPSARQSNGLGLGLTISRSIVEQHGGRLVALSDGKGLGATFIIEIPAVEAPLIAPVPDEPPAPKALVPHQCLTILFVEDNADTLNYLSRMLRLRGHTVHTAADIATAFHVAAETEIDLLISDVELPDGSGLQLVRNLHSSREVPAIALSGFGSSDDIELSQSAGFSVHLTKPVDFRTLEEVIQRLAVGRGVPSLVES